jgi:hypothetical protein
MYTVLNAKGGDRFAQDPKQRSKEIIAFMNEAFYGQKFDDTMKDARALLTKVNNTLDPKHQRAITDARVRRLANDMMRANVTIGGGLSNDTVLAAAYSAYDTASYGMGQAPNNAMSRGVAAMRANFRRKEAELIKNKDWNRLSDLYVKNTLLETFGIRFLGGATNWLVWKANKLVLGAPALFTTFMGDSNGQKKWQKSTVNFENVRQMRTDLTEMNKARQKMALGVIASAQAIGGWMFFAGIAAALGGSSEDKDKLEKLKKLQDQLKLAKTQETDRDFKAAYDNLMAGNANDIAKLEGSTSINGYIQQHPLARKYFNVFATEQQMAAFYLESYKDSKGGYFYGLLQYAEATLGTRYDVSAQLTDVAALARMGDVDAAKGVLGQVIGDRISVPLWKPLHDNYQLVTMNAGQPGDYRQPNSFLEGALGGGALQTLTHSVGLHIFDPTITSLRGMGAASFEKFKAQGIEDVSQFRKYYPGILNLAGPDGAPILDKGGQKKVKADYERYASQEWGDKFDAAGNVVGKK